MTFLEKKIPIDSLSLWDENARFPDQYFNSDEKELIRYFISKPNFKIKELVDEIVNDFDLPLLEKVVVWDSVKGFIVLEGNRRLTGYKLLANPSIISDINSKLHSFLIEKQSSIKISNDFMLDCLVSEDKDQCYRYIDRKHSKGNNQVNWLEPERINYSKRRGVENQNERIKNAITKFVRGLDLPKEIINEVLGRGYVTTFYRFVTTGPAKDTFGLSTNAKGDLLFRDKAFPEKLKVIIYNVLKKEDFEGKKVDSRELNKNPEIKNYLESVKAEHAKKVDEEINENTHTTIFGDNKISVKVGQKTRILPKSTSRKYLIPNSCRIKITEPKINNIFRELREDLLLDETNKSVPNAVGVLFRVFLEVSLDHYAKMNMKIFKKTATISQKIPWIVENLVSKGYDSKIFNNINKVGSAKRENTYLSIDNFHEYVHSTTTQPSSNELKLKWDNLQEFFEILWEDLIKKSKS